MDARKPAKIKKTKRQAAVLAFGQCSHTTDSVSGRCGRRREASAQGEGFDASVSTNRLIASKR